MNREEARENAIATAKWLNDEGTSEADIFIFIAAVLNHAITWEKTKTGHEPIYKVHEKLVSFAYNERD